MLRKDKTMPRNEDMFVVHVDAQTIEMVDRWAHRLTLQPSRRQAVRALIRAGLRQVQKPPRATEPAASEQTAVS